MANISESMDQIIYVGIGIFVLVLILSLTYQGYAQSNQQMNSTFCKAGSGAYCFVGQNDVVPQIGAAYVNYTKYAGTLPNTFGGALQLAVFALVFIAVILAVVGALRGGGIGSSGGFLSK